MKPKLARTPSPETSEQLRNRSAPVFCTARVGGRSPFHMKWKPISGVEPRGSLLLNAVTDLERMIEQTLDAEKK